MAPQEPRLDGYETVELIDVGGTSEIWRMRAVDGTQDVAVKIYPRDAALCGREEWRLRHRLTGEHVLAALDLTVTTDGRPALVMPYCAGGSLARLVAVRGPLTAGELTAVLTPVLEVLADLHAHALVHADLHPKNILFTEQGQVRVSDLGSVRDLGDDAPDTWHTESYTAPEVLDGERPDPASDVYSCAAVAWFALAGQPPPAPALRPRLHDLVDDVEAEVCEAITSALSLTPTARPDVEALSQVVRQATVAVPPPLPDPDATGERDVVGAVTRRRRCVAVQREQERSGDDFSRVSRRRPVWSTAVPAGFVGIALIAAATWIPIPQTGQAPKKTAAPSPAVASQKASAPATARPPGPARSPQRGQAVPTVEEIGDLLACRARAWMSGNAASLRSCLAARSQALGDDEARLRDAARQRLTYSGLSFRVGRIHQVVIDHGYPTVRVSITRSSYQVHTPGRTETVPAQEVTARLTFRGAPGQWRISSWNVV